MLYLLDGVRHKNRVTHIKHSVFRYGLGYVLESQIIRNDFLARSVGILAMSTLHCFIIVF